MTHTLRINARNDLHLPARILKALNLSDDRMVKAEVRGNTIIIVPVDIEPRYSHEELEGLNRIHQTEKKKGWIPLKSDKDIDRLLK